MADNPKARPFLRRAKNSHEYTEADRVRLFELDQERAALIKSGGRQDELDKALHHLRLEQDHIKTRYLTLKEYRAEIESGSLELPMFDAEGCGCFTDDEEAA